MAADKSDSGSATPENGGKKYLEDKRWLKESVEKHSKDIEILQTDVSDIKSKVSVLDEIKDLSRQTNETVIRMDEKQGNFVTKEKYLEDKVAEVSGVHKVPKDPEEGGWKRAYTIIAVVAGILGLLTTLGVSIVVRPTSEAAALSDESSKSLNLDKNSEIKVLMNQQKQLINDINKLIQAHGVKADEHKANAVTANEKKSNSGG